MRTGRKTEGEDREAKIGKGGWSRRMQDEKSEREHGGDDSRRWKMRRPRGYLRLRTLRYTRSHLFERIDDHSTSVQTLRF